MNDCYNDIINYKYTGSKTRCKMKIENRASIFAPFAALTGFYEKIKEKELIVINKKVLSNDEIIKLDNKLKKINKGDLVQITYFKEKINNKGNYIKINSYVKKIDVIYKKILFSNEIYINFEDIIDIQIYK